MSSIETAMKLMAEYAAGLASNWRAANAADEIASLAQKAGIGNCSVDISWSPSGGATVQCHGRIDREADIRRLLHEVAERHGIELKEPKRIDSLKTYGNVSVDYGTLRVSLMPDGYHCRRVQIGTRRVEAKEEPVWDIICEEPEHAAPADAEASL